MEGHIIEIFFFLGLPLAAVGFFIMYKFYQAINKSGRSSEPVSINEKIRQLEKLKNDGVISEIEFEEKKKDLIRKF